MADAHFWTEERLLNLITQGVPESSGLEYKGAGSVSREPKKIDELTKDISAFANAAGGTLVLGMQENRDTQMPVVLDPIDEKAFGREWMDQLLDRIRPKIVGVTIHPVRVSVPRTGVAYVLQIPQSTTAHQATDKRYYKRRNFKCDPMEDYEIRDVMNRRTLPVVETHIRLLFERGEDSGFLWWRVRNVGSVMARHVYTLIEAPFSTPGNQLENGPWLCFDFDQAANRRFSPKRSTNDGLDLVRWELSMSNIDSRPLFPGSELTARVKFQVDVQGLTHDLRPETQLRYSTFADNMIPVTGTLDPQAIKVVQAIT